MFSLLHISDLHQSPNDPIDTSSLLELLVADRERHRPEEMKPQAVAVSGDIVYGSTMDDPDYISDLKKQYDKSYEFLAQLADRFVEGDRSQVALVPGNHDICWNTSRQSMAKTEKLPVDIHKALFQKHSPYRWSWTDLQLYTIANADLYAQRLDAYWDFIERFYSEANLAFPINRDRGFNLFEFDNGHILLAAFESVVGNDCFSRSGRLADDAVGKCVMALKQRGRSYDLQTAMFHHGVYGHPSDNGSVGINVLQAMIGHGFRLALHGHQHYANCATHCIHLPDKYSIAVVAAGSLCAGHSELPRGTNRQYNVIVIGDKYDCATVYCREMSAGNHFAPARGGQFDINGAVNLSWASATDLAGRPLASTINDDKVKSAEVASMNGDHDVALQALDSLDLAPDSYARDLFLSIAEKAGAWNLIIAKITSPNNANELVLLCRALEIQGDKQAAADMLSGYAEHVGLAQHIQNAIFRKLKIGTMLGVGQ